MDLKQFLLENYTEEEILELGEMWAFSRNEGEGFYEWVIRCMEIGMLEILYGGEFDED